MLTGATTEGIHSIACQQGGLGFILTVLIVTAPPMAASFFQDMLGAFTLYTAFSSDGGAAASRNGRWGGGNRYPPGHGGNPGGEQPSLGARDGEMQGNRNFNGSYMAGFTALYSGARSEENPSELQYLMRISYA